MIYLLAVLPGLLAIVGIVVQNPSLETAIIAITSLVITITGILLSKKLEAIYSPKRVAFMLIAFVVAIISASLSVSLSKGISQYLPWVIFSVLSGWGIYFALTFNESVDDTPASPLPMPTILETEKPKRKEGKIKVLDTSIVIDGRIIDIAGTGFIEGPFVVPNFVLREIQLISDSSDPIKRNRGRRGLDMLNQLQKRDDLEVKIDYKDYSETREVDAKLIRLAKDRSGTLVTNDFNLNKVAEFQGVKVLNLNNLANALKPVVLPGEELELQVVKEGKDENQGIGYLDDGTMVVIENGAKLLGKKVKVDVTSVIQTNSGKMFFTKISGGK